MDYGLAMFLLGVIAGALAMRLIEAIVPTS